MNDQDAMWAAAIEDPLNETPRLVLADLLQEHGFSELAAAFRMVAGQFFVRCAANASEGDVVLRLFALSEQERLTEITDLISEHTQDIIDSDDVNSIIAETNATMWSVDEYEVTNAEIVPGGYNAELTFSASGDHDGDHAFCGDRLQGRADALIDPSGNVSFTVTAVELEDYSE